MNETMRISYDRFMQTDLRVARVLEAEAIEGTDRLLRLQVDLGEERRQIVAGVADGYAPQELVGARIIVVANLKPAHIRGVVSQGMLLATELDGRSVVVRVDESVPPGTRVS